MRADTFARLLTLEALVDAEIAWWLEHRPPSTERFREGMISRISDLVDEIDALDAVAAARVYDAVVDFLSELPDGAEADEAVVEATVRFKRAVDRIVERAMEPRELDDAPTWAVVLDELLEELVLEYAAAAENASAPDARAYRRCELLTARALDAADHLARHVRAERRPELRSEVDRLAFAVRGRRPPPPEVERLARAAQRVARRHRPTRISSIGSFIVGQLMRRRGRDAGG